MAPAPDAASHDRQGQYLTFGLAGETFAVDVHNAQTVIEESRVTKIPRMPEFMMGVIDFRGRAVPLIDLRAKLQVGAAASVGEPTSAGAPASEGDSVSDEPSAEDTSLVVVIMEIPWNDRPVVLGVTVDEVKEVINLEESEIEDPPSVGLAADLSYMRGIARKDDQFLLILEADRILGYEELSELGRHVDALAAAGREVGEPAGGEPKR